ncbi:MAG: hypothetical protein COY80_05255 [Candidatus Pacebacteria bacterium CG_4_10_14_0_8_um_filter_42_14]|nr:MAG: hypothetical protein COY80_05255 [Candidatus Pacebacteria bacterium CG_4_10_14_0_8_um_filter_42_14]
MAYSTKEESLSTGALLMKWFLVFIGMLIAGLLAKSLYALQDSDDLLHIIFCDVGQGDTILISYHLSQILIDAGRGEQVLSCLWQYLPAGDRELELVVATHPDADHIGGMPFVFDQFGVKQLLLPPVRKETADFIALEEAVSRENELQSPPFVAETGIELAVGGEVRMRVLAPSKPKTPEAILSDFSEYISLNDGGANDWSIVLYLSFQQFSALFTGDLEAKGELALLSAGLLSDVDLLKVAHHGSKSSTTDDFLRVIRPEISVVSVGENNTYGHPAPQTMDLLQEMGSLILRTDVLGSVHIVSDGKNYWVVR